MGFLGGLAKTLGVGGKPPRARPYQPSRARLASSEKEWLSEIRGFEPGFTEEEKGLMVQRARKGISGEARAGRERIEDYFARAGGFGPKSGVAGKQLARLEMGTQGALADVAGAIEISDAIERRKNMLAKIKALQNYYATLAGVDVEAEKIRYGSELTRFGYKAKGIEELAEGLEDIGLGAGAVFG